MANGFKVWAVGDRVTAADMNDYVQEQTVGIFADATARDAQITGPIEGQTAYLKDTNSITVYSGSAWVTIADLEVLTVDSTNNRVGIGTTSPSDVLELESSGPLIRLTSNNTAPGDGTLIGGIHWEGNDASTASGIGAWVAVYGDGTSGEQQMRFGTGTQGSAAHRMTIDSSGDVGIGTTSPSQKLDVAGSIVIPTGNGVMFDRSGTDLDVLFKETPTSTTYATGDDVVLRNPNGADIRFQTSGSNDRMTIDSAGRVGIGTTSPSYNLDVNGAEDTASRININSANTANRYLMRFSRNASVFSQGIYCDTATAYFGTPSDVNLKTGIETIPTSDALTAINQLRAVHYRYLLDADDVVRRGFIAQEVEDVLPEAVHRVGGGHPTTRLTLDENGDLQAESVDENGDPLVQEEPDILLAWEPITTTLVGAVQELSSLVATLTARIEALEAA